LSSPTATTTTAASRLTRPPGSSSKTSTSTTTIPTPKRPLNGGVESLGAEQIAWTGGPRAKLRTRPASTKAYRPSDYKSKRKCEEDCTEGIGDKFQLKTPDEIIKDADAVLFVDWIDQLRMYMEDTGQDGVFYLEDEDDKEVYFLTEFEAFDVEETTKAVKTIKDKDCSYDESNLKTSGIAIRASLSTTMLQRIKGLVPVNASGPETLAAIVAAHQVLDSSGCRNLVEELRKMKLHDFPAENVDEFRLKLRPRQSVDLPSPTAAASSNSRRWVSSRKLVAVSTRTIFPGARHAIDGCIRSKIIVIRSNTIMVVEYFF
jgi:hypothetical protein